MTNKDNLNQPKGILHLRAIDRHGRELWSMTDSNLIVAGGYRITAEALAGTPGTKISNVAIGTNTTEPQETDTQITNAVMTTIQNVEYPAPSTVRFHFRFEYTDAVGMSIAEFGLLSADGRLFSRKVRAVIEKTEHMTIVGMWDIIV